MATSYSFMRFQKATLGTSLGSKTATLRHALARGLGAQEPHFWSGLVAHTLSQNLQENSFDSSVMPESEDILLFSSHIHFPLLILKIPSTLLWGRRRGGR